MEKRKFNPFINLKCIKFTSLLPDVFVQVLASFCPIDFNDWYTPLAVSRLTPNFINYIHLALFTLFHSPIHTLRAGTLLYCVLSRNKRFYSMTSEFYRWAGKREVIKWMALTMKVRSCVSLNDFWQKTTNLRKERFSMGRKDNIDNGWKMFEKFCRLRNRLLVPNEYIRYMIYVHFKW